MNQRGSSSAMLLISWMALIGFLGFAFDMALLHVYREQLNTALEAAATAGAMQARYQLTVRLVRDRYYSVREEACYLLFDAVGNPVLDGNGQQMESCDVWYEWRIEAAPDVYVTDWEEKVWWSHAWAGLGQRPKALHEAFPVHCSARPKDEPAYGGRVVDVCKQAEAVAGSCGLLEYPQGTAAEKAWEAYSANRTRWAGAMVDTPAYPVILEEGTGFVVGMTATAQIETRFVRVLGFDSLPVTPKTLDGTAYIKAHPIRHTAPPTCPKPQ